MKNYLTTSSGVRKIGAFLVFLVFLGSQVATVAQVDLSVTIDSTAYPAGAICTTDGDTLTLSNSTITVAYSTATLLPGDYEFTWTGPNGFSLSSPGDAAPFFEEDLDAVTKGGEYCLEVRFAGETAQACFTVEIEETVVWECPTTDFVVSSGQSCQPKMTYNLLVDEINCNYSLNYCGTVILNGMALSTGKQTTPGSGALEENVEVPLCYNFYETITNTDGSMTDTIYFGSHQLFIELKDNNNSSAVIESCLINVEVIEGTSNVACNDQVNVTMDEDCNALVSPDMILEGDFCFDAFTLEIDGLESGNSIMLTEPGNYVVTVTNGSGKRCWGNILAEDKNIPEIDCGDPVTVKCSMADNITAGSRIRCQDTELASAFTTDTDGNITNTISVAAVPANSTTGFTSTTLSFDFNAEPGTIVNMELDFFAQIAELQDLSLKLVTPDPDGDATATSTLDRDTLVIADFGEVLAFGGFTPCTNSNIKVYFSDNAPKTYTELLLTCNNGNFAALGPFQPKDAFSVLNGTELAYDSDPTNTTPVVNDLGIWQLIVCNTGSTAITIENAALRVTQDKGQILGGADLTGTTGCGSDVIYTSEDNVITQDCTDQFYQIIERTWTVTNGETGLSESCEQTINLERWALSELIMPPNYDGLTFPVLNCDEIIDQQGNLDITRVNPVDTIPLPSYTGMPDVPFGTLCDNFQITYTDTKISLCGSFDSKIIRQWQIVDWCDSKIRPHTQIIKIQNSGLVEVICAPDTTNGIEMTDVNGDAFMAFLGGSDASSVCGSDWEVVPPLSVTASCGVSIENVVVEFKIADEMGLPPVGTDFESFDAETGARVETDANGAVIIRDLPAGLTWLRYTATDECGNTGECFEEVFIEDRTKPNPACIKNTIVAIGESGCAFLQAISLDNSSWDNCGVVGYEISRDQTVWEEKLEYCCGCMMEEETVFLRVSDEAGNSNVCQVNVQLQNNDLPTVTGGPVNIDTTCFSATGTPTVLDLFAIAEAGVAAFDFVTNCPNNTTTYSVEYFRGDGTTPILPGDTFEPGDCGQSTMVIKYQIFDDCENQFATHDQELRFVADYSGFDVVETSWPQDTDLSSCEGMDDPSSLGGQFDGSQIQTVGTSCNSNIAITWNDLRFEDIDDACVKILREWTVIDWCIANELGVDFAKRTHTQVIKIDDNEAPVITGLRDLVGGDPSCQYLLTEDSLAHLVITDDCTDLEDIIIAYQVDSVATLDIFNQWYDSGTTITIILTDHCDNQNTYSFVLRTVDTQVPVPYCNSVVVTGLNDDGVAEIWVSDFSQGAQDNCDTDVDDYFINPLGMQTQVLTFDCDSISNGISDSIIVVTYFEDDFGNVNSCVSTLILQDNNDVCEDDPMVGSITISGEIYTEEEQMVEEVQVDLMENNNMMANMTTTTNGNYAFRPSSGHSYNVVPHRNDNYLNGVSTVDLVIIQRHILGIQPLTSPYKVIAADINNSGTINGLDLVELRKLILGIYVELPQNDSWRFPVEDQYFADQFLPFPFDESIDINNLRTDMSGQDFIGVKVGDVNASANANLTGTPVNTRNAKSLDIVVKDMGLIEGSIVTVPFYAKNMNDIVGFQSTMSYNNSVLEFVGINDSALDITEDNLGLQNLAGGYITLSWNSLNGVTLDQDRVLFEIDFMVKSSGNLSEQLFLSSALTSSEAYDSELNTINLGMSYEGIDMSDFVLYQNIPNPFAEETEIRFNLPGTSAVTFTVYDVEGREIIRRTSNYELGNHTILLNRAELNTTGVMYYKLETAYGTATRKMIQLR